MSDQETVTASPAPKAPRKKATEEKQVRLRKGRASAQNYTVPARVRIFKDVLIRMREQAKIYGGYGRTLQIALELMTRDKELIPKRMPKMDGDKVGYSFKIPQRTVDQIEKIAPLFESRGHLIQAAVIVLERG